MPLQQRSCLVLRSLCDLKFKWVGTANAIGRLLGSFDKRPHSPLAALHSSSPAALESVSQTRQAQNDYATDDHQREA